MPLLPTRAPAAPCPDELPVLGSSSPLPFPLEPDALLWGDVQLRCHTVRLGDGVRQVSDYAFSIDRRTDHAVVGRLAFRVSDERRFTHYFGQIGYAVDPVFRGHHYAAQAVQAVLPFVRRHGITALWVMCAPTNLASRRTLETAGFTLVEIVPVPLPFQSVGAHACRYLRDLTD